MRHNVVIGVDEAGRGALAGPLVAAAVKIRNGRAFPFDYVKDSKQLSDSQRRALLVDIIASCDVQYGAVSSRLLDRIGLQAANVLAIERALLNFGERHAVMADFVGAFEKYACFSWNITLYTRGESKFPEIAAASVAAKVYRDDLMIMLSKEFPAYEFEKHKGYGTELHRKAIRKNGRSAVQRLTFAF